MKELPKMYHNNINKKINNNEKIFTTIYNDTYEKKKLSRNNVFDSYSIEKKIRGIFNSPNYVYKMDVVIVTDDEIIDECIVGKTGNNLITMDNKYIPINKIKDIYIDDKNK